MKKFLAAVLVLAMLVSMLSLLPAASAEAPAAPAEKPTAQPLFLPQAKMQTSPFRCADAGF